MSHEVRSKMFQKYGAWLQANYAVDRTDKTRHRLSALKKDYDEFAAEHEYPIGKIIGIAEFFRREAKLPIEKAGKKVSGRAVVIGLVKQSRGRVRSDGKQTPEKAAVIAPVTPKIKKPIAPKSPQVSPQRTIQAIETRYKGYRFRSRLEARWAVFFDHLGMEWQYEPEGYVLSDGTRYLPDFWVPLAEDPSRGYWVEIKPRALTDEEHEKCRLLAIESGHNVCVLAGEVWPGKFLQQKWALDGQFFDFTKTNDDHYLMEYVAYPCGASGTCNMDFTGAYAAARSARFEHGEKGAA